MDKQKSEQRKVDTRHKLFTRILDTVASTKKCADQLQQSICNLCMWAAKCFEVGWCDFVTLLLTVTNFATYV